MDSKAKTDRDNGTDKENRTLSGRFCATGKQTQKENKKEQTWLQDATENLKEFITPDLDDFIDSREIRRDWDKLMNTNDPKRMEFMWRVINLGVWRQAYFN